MKLLFSKENVFMKSYHCKSWVFIVCSLQKILYFKKLTKENDVIRMRQNENQNHNKEEFSFAYNDFIIQP